MAEIYDRVINNASPNTSDSIILGRIKPGATILECGCATGYMTRYLKEKLTARVSIIEYNEKAFNIAKQFAVEGLCADLDDTEKWSNYFKGQQFDYILFADVLEHLRNPEQVLRCAGQLLKDDGEVLASIPNVAHADVVLNLYHNQWNYKKFGLLDDTHIHFWGPDNIRKLYASTDLTPVEIDCSIVPPLQSEQANSQIAAVDMAIVDSVCRRDRSDLYQFVVAAKKSEYVLKHRIECIDRYEERHKAYGMFPDFCKEYEKKLEDQKAIRVAEKEQMTYLLDIQQQLTCSNQRLTDDLRDAIRKNEKILTDNIELNRKLDSSCITENQLTAENRMLREQLAASEHAYNVISNAFFWKVTYPLRRITDCLKNRLRNVRLCRLTWKGLKCLKQNGIHYTYKRLKHFLQYGETKVLSNESNGNTSFYMPGDPITILTTKHTMYVAKLLEESIRRLTIETRIISEDQNSYGDEVHIVICPQIFKKLPGRYIAFQMEQTVSSRWLTDEYDKRLQNAYAVFDYSLVNIKYFKTNRDFGKMFYYLPVDYLPGLRRNIEGYQYDVAFYGDINNQRRREILDELQKSFNVKVITEVFGEELYDELSKAKIVVNLHYYENALLETTRIYEVLSLGNSVVVSEKSTDINEEEKLNDIVDFIDVGDITQLKNRITYWLSNEKERVSKVNKNNEILEEKTSAFDYYFYRFLLANDWIDFNHFYELVGSFVEFKGNRVCLSLPEEVERREAFDQDNKYGFEVFPGLRHKRGWTGCGLSYKFIMKKAQEQKLENILVCEDDVFFPNDFEKRFQACMNYMDGEQDWDVFQGLMADVGNVTISQVDTVNNQTFVHIDHMISTVFNLYSKEVYPYVIVWNEKNEDVHTNTIDRSLEAKDLKVIATVPFLVGHKEDLNSSVWGFNNSQYNDMIEASGKKLKKLVEKFENTKV